MMSGEEKMAGAREVKTPTFLLSQRTSWLSRGQKFIIETLRRAQVKSMFPHVPLSIVS